MFGPYLPRPDASPMVRRELDEWFGAFAPDGQPRVDRGTGEQHDRAAFFTDANGCVARRAWEQVPFRPVSYAEDQMLARDMLAAGWAKAYVPAAAVTHSHEYAPWARLRRSFDESRALREVRGQRARAGAGAVVMSVQRNVRDDLGLLRREGQPAARRAAVLAPSLAHHAARAVGATLGSRADRLPARVRRVLSLERRARLRSPMLNRFLNDLPKRAALTVRTYGWVNLLGRIVTAPLRPLGLDRGVRRKLQQRSALRGTLRWYRENGRPW